jgi:hypothetical protein
MRREPLQRRRLRSSRAIPSAACVPTNSATIRLTLLGGSGFAKACTWPVCLRANVRVGVKRRPSGAADLGLFNPQQRTSEDCRRTSEKCQQQKWNSHRPMKVAANRGALHQCFTGAAGGGVGAVVLAWIPHFFSWKPTHESYVRAACAALYLALHSFMVSAALLADVQHKHSAVTIAHCGS